MTENNSWPPPSGDAPEGAGSSAPSGVDYTKPSAPAVPSTPAEPFAAPAAPQAQPQYGQPAYGQPAYGQPAGQEQWNPAGAPMSPPPGYTQPPAMPVQGYPGGGQSYGQPAPGYGAPVGYGAAGAAGAAGMYGATPGYGTPGLGQPGFGQQVAPGAPPAHLIATTGSRVLARIIDFVGLGAVFGVLMLMGLAGLVAGVNDDGEPSAGFFAALVGVIIAAALFFLVALIYEVVFVAVKGATLGKMAMGIRVVREHGALPGWGPSILRWLLPNGVGFLASALSGGFLGIAQFVVYLSFVWDPQKQGWHDKVAKTWVVRTR